MGITSIAKKVVTKAEGIGKKVTKVVSDMGKKVVSKKEKPKVEEEEEDKTEDDYSRGTGD